MSAPLFHRVREPQLAAELDRTVEMELRCALRAPDEGRDSRLKERILRGDLRLYAYGSTRMVVHPYAAPLGLGLWVYCLAGRLDEVRAALGEFLAAARAEGAVEIGCRGRPGWRRILRGGYERSCVGWIRPI